MPEDSPRKEPRANPWTAVRDTVRGAVRGTLRDTPPLLVAAVVLFFCASYFASRFPDVPGASLGSYASTLLIAAPAVVALFRYLGPRRAALGLGALSAFAFAIETTGVVTGFPYGAFYYGEALGPKVLGLVPLLLPVSYVPLVIGAVAATASASGRGAPRGAGVLVWTLRAAVLLVVVDAVLDPGAVALGFWVWPEGGAYYGVPLSNYFGWLLSGALAAGLLLRLGWEKPPLPGLLDSLLLSLGFWTGVAVFNALLVPALVGALLLAYLLRRRVRLRRDSGGGGGKPSGAPR